MKFPLFLVFTGEQILVFAVPQLLFSLGFLYIR